MSNSSSLDKMRNIDSIDDFGKFVDFLEPSIGKWGGRKFVVSTCKEPGSERHNPDLTMNSIVAHFGKIVKDSSISEKDIKEIILMFPKIQILDKAANIELSKKSLFIRILTMFRQLVGNFFYNSANPKREKVLEEIAKKLHPHLIRVDINLEEMPFPSSALQTKPPKANKEDLFSGMIVKELSLWDSTNKKYSRFIEKVRDLGIFNEYAEKLFQQKNDDIASRFFTTYKLIDTTVENDASLSNMKGIPDKLQGEFIKFVACKMELDDGFQELQKHLKQKAKNMLIDLARDNLREELVNIESPEETNIKFEKMKSEIDPQQIIRQIEDLCKLVDISTIGVSFKIREEIEKYKEFLLLCGQVQEI